MPLAQAAAVLGLSHRHVRRMCQSGTLVATMVDGEYQIDPTSHPTLRVAAGDTAALVTTDSPLAGLTAAKRQTMLQRYEILQQYQAAMAHKPANQPAKKYAAAWLELLAARSGTRVSYSTILQWSARFDDQGVSGLVDGRRFSGSVSVSAEAWELFKGLYLSQNRPQASLIWEEVAAHAQREGWQWPGLRTIQRWARERLDPKLALAGRDPKKFRDRCVATAVRDWSQVPAMGCWVADHRQFDVFLPRPVWDEKKTRTIYKWYKPWVTAFLDARTWMPVAWTISFDAPDGNRVMATFVRGVIQHGKPAHLYLDNGKDFRMRQFAGGRSRPAKPGEKIVAETIVRPLLKTLGVESTFAMPFNARAKVIENWFRLVSERFDRTFATYAGNKASVNRPERMMGCGPDRKSSLHGKAAELFQAGLTIEAFTKTFNAWVTTDYALRESPAPSCNGLSTIRAFHELRGDAWQASRPSEADLALLLMRSVSVRVEANGIYVRPFGQYYWSDELEDRRCGSGRDERRKVSYRYDPDDASRIYVFDGQSDVYLCLATPYVGSGMHPLARTSGNAQDSEQLADQIALSRRLQKHTKQELSALRRFAGNAILADRADGARVLGRIDEAARTSDLVAAATPPAILQLPDLQIAKAAQDGIKHRSDQQRSERAMSARDFFANATCKKTGTDGTVGSAQSDETRSVSPLDLLPMDGTLCQETQPQGERHDDAAGTAPQDD